MDNILRSVGLDVGTTTTQLVVSELTARNRASGFAVPRMEITGRKVVYQSPVCFTPLLSGELVDGEGIRAIVEREYRAAGITPESVDTGAVIITGETSRKENAQAVLHALSRYAGDFVVATAGPELESALAARGAGAVACSEETGKPVLHMDIGGGTSNLALCENGKITHVGCLNVGGRLLKLDSAGTVTYVSPVLREVTDYSAGIRLSPAQAMETARMLASVLEMAAGLRPRDALFTHFVTAGTESVPVPDGVTVSFSGGVADCVEKDIPWLEFGDLGPLLGRAIRESRLCRGSYRLGEQTIRATVIGAGCHSAQLSGSTVFLRNARLPERNLPVVSLSAEEQELPEAELTQLIRQRMERLETWGVLHLPGWTAPHYPKVAALGKSIACAMAEKPCRVALEADMAKALGNAIALHRSENTQLLCLDGITVPPQSYLDIGAPVGPAVTVVVKTLVFDR